MNTYGPGKDKCSWGRIELQNWESREMDGLGHRRMDATLRLGP